MSRQDFFPYETRPGALNLSAKLVSGKALQESKDRITVPNDCNSDVHVRFAVVVPPEIQSEVFAELEGKKVPAAIYLVFQGLRSRRRLSLKTNGKGGLFRADYAFNRSDWFGEVLCRAVLARTSANASVPLGFAADKGSQVSWSNDARIVFDDVNAPKGKNLSIQWANFRESEKAWLRDHADDLFCVSYQTAPPTILLNSSVPNLQVVLENRGTHGKNAAIRDAVFAQITHQVWTSILADVLDEAARGTDGQPTLETLAQWQQDVITGWAPYLIPERDREEAIDEILSQLSDTGWPDELLGERLPNAIQARLGTVKYFQALCSEIT